MKNITLSANSEWIEEARRIAVNNKSTLNAEFRKWLQSFIGRKSKSNRLNEFLNKHATVDAGGKFTREEMNER
jgi:hypothetical protein